MVLSSASIAIDIRTLVPPDSLNKTAHAVVPVLEDNLRRSYSTPPDSSCHVAVYAQMHPSNVSAMDIRELEDELMHPTGVTTVSRQLALVLVSPDCGVLTEV
jgi:transmembrane E3 ubiquitin-protein ligase